MALGDSSYESIEKYSLGLRGYFILILLTAVYFAAYQFLPTNIRYSFLFFLGGTFLIAWQPRPSFWLPFLPVIFLLSYPVINLDLFHPQMATLFMFAFTAWFIIDRIVWDEPVFFFYGIVYLFCAALIIQLLSIFLSVHIGGQYVWNAIRDGSGIFLFFPLIFIIPAICNTEETLISLIRAVVIALLTASIIGAVEYFSISGFSRIDLAIGYLYKGRVASLFGNSNVFAGYLELCIPLALAMFFMEKKLAWKILALAAVLFGFFSTLYTFSRGGLFFVVIGLFIVLFFRFRKKILVPIVIGIALVILLLTNADVFERQISFFINPESNLSQPTILHRYITYRGYLHQFSEYPLLGIGWGAKEFFWGRTNIYSFWEVRHIVSSETIRHFGGLNSLFLNHLVKGGVISLFSVLLVFFGFLMAVFRSFGRNRLLVMSIAAGIIAFTGHQFVDNLLQWSQVNAMFWFLIGIVCACAYPSFPRNIDSE